MGTFLEEAPQMLAELRAGRWPAATAEASAAPRIRSSPTASTFGACAWPPMARAGTRRAGRDEHGRPDALQAEYARGRRAAGALPPWLSAAPAGGADDNKVNRLLLSRSLEQLGHRVASAENGRVALEMLRREASTCCCWTWRCPR